MLRATNQSEKEYRDTQTVFGHLSHATDLNSWLRDNYWDGSVRERRYHQIADDFLASSEPLRVLEVAAGVGDFIEYCAKLFPEHAYSANELSEAQLKNNIGMVAEHFKIRMLTELSFGPVESLGYGDAEFDLVFIKAAVHHFENPRKGFEEIHRILKPGGRVIFFEDPVVLDIPLYRGWKKRHFSLAERALGINEHIYTIRDYLSFGELFGRRSYHLDRVLVEEYDRQQSKRKRVKRFFGVVVRRSKFLFLYFMIWRFSPIIFVFEKLQISVV